jgi:hypothetical protein
MSAEIDIIRHYAEKYGRLLTTVKFALPELEDFTAWSMSMPGEPGSCCGPCRRTSARSSQGRTTKHDPVSERLRQTAEWQRRMADPDVYVLTRRRLNWAAGFALLTNLLLVGVN